MPSASLYFSPHRPPIKKSSLCQQARDRRIAKNEKLIEKYDHLLKHDCISWKTNKEQGTRKPRGSVADAIAFHALGVQKSDQKDCGVFPGRLW